MSNTDDNFSMEDELESGSSEEEKEYEVEEIRDHSITKQGKKFVTTYLIKWVGYGEADNTWENEKNVYALDMVANYWNKKSDNDPDKVLYYKANKKKLPSKVVQEEALKKNGSLLSSSSSTAATNRLASSSESLSSPVLHVERKKIERQPVTSSSKATTSSSAETRESGSQKRIDQLFSFKKTTTESPVQTSRKGKEKDLDNTTTTATTATTATITTTTTTNNKHNHNDENDDDIDVGERKSRTSKKPNYKDLEEGDLMDLDVDGDEVVQVETNNNKSADPNEVIDDENYNKEIADWQPIAQEVCYIGREFQGAPLYCVIKWKNGKRSLHACSVVRNKCPKLLVDAFIKEYSKVNPETDTIDID